MKRLSSDTVELSREEQRAFWQFRHRLDVGDTIDQAIDHIRFKGMSPDFEKWLAS